MAGLAARGGLLVDLGRSDPVPDPEKALGGLVPDKAFRRKPWPSFDGSGMDGGARGGILCTAEDPGPGPAGSALCCADPASAIHRRRSLLLPAAGGGDTGGSAPPLPEPDAAAASPVAEPCASACGAPAKLDLNSFRSGRAPRPPSAAATPLRLANGAAGASPSPARAAAAARCRALEMLRASWRWGAWRVSAALAAATACCLHSWAICFCRRECGREVQWKEDMSFPRYACAYASLSTLGTPRTGRVHEISAEHRWPGEEWLRAEPTLQGGVGRGGARRGYAHVVRSKAGGHPLADEGAQARLHARHVSLRLEGDHRGALEALHGVLNAHALKREGAERLSQD